MRSVLDFAFAGYLWVGLWSTALVLVDAGWPRSDGNSLAWFTIDYGLVIVVGLFVFMAALPTLVVAVIAVAPSLYAARAGWQPQSVAGALLTPAPAGWLVLTGALALPTAWRAGPALLAAVILAGLSLDWFCRARRRTV